MYAKSSQPILRRVRALLESRSASFWTLGAWLAFTVVWVIPFQVTGQPAETIRAIAEDWLVLRVVYGVVGVTTLACGAARLSRDIPRLQHRGLIDSPTRDAVPIDLELGVLADRLQERGFLVSAGERAVHAVRNRWSILGGSLFHIGIVLLGVSLVGHLLTVETVTLRVTEGQTFAEAAESADVAALPTRARELTLEAIEPGYYRDVLLFTKLEARTSDVAGKMRTMSLAKPLWLEPTVLMSIADYNLAPHIEVSDFRGDVPIPNEYVVAMNLSPPGAEDAANIPEVPLDISLIAYPDHGVVDGKDVSLSYNITNPAFLLAVSEQGRSGSLLARQLVKLGEGVSAGDYIVRITALSRYGSFRITRAPALPFMALAWLVTTLGVTWRYVLRRQTIVAWDTPDGVLVDGWFDLGGREVGRRKALEMLAREEGAS